MTVAHELDFRMCLLQAEINMQAMIAENKRRELDGQSLTYSEAAFISLIEKHGIHHNRLYAQEEE